MTALFLLTSEVNPELELTKNRRHTDPNGKYDQNEIKRNKGLNYFKPKLPYIYFGLQYKPSSGSEWKKVCEKKTVTHTP